MKEQTKLEKGLSATAQVNQLNRREFIRTSTMGMASLAVCNSFPIGAFPAISQNAGSPYSLNPLFNNKLKVQFVIGGLIHESDVPGPCRSAPREYMTTEAETKLHTHNFELRKRQIREWAFPVEAQILEPVDFKMQVRKKNVEFEFPESEFANIDKRIDNIDLLLVMDGFTGDICIKLAERYKKPVATIVHSDNSLRKDITYGGWLVDMTAATHQKGLESYLALDWDDLNRIISLLWVKKAFAHTRLLIFTDRFGKPPYGMESVITDFDSLNRMYGIEYHHAYNQILGNEIERIGREPSELEKARQLTDLLFQTAKAVNMPKKYLLESVIACNAAKNLMDQYGCNAFTIECREICPLEMADKYKFTPCMIHSLLKDNGYPSVCQSDVNALLAMMALMFVSKKSAYMGNPGYDVKKNILTLLHDVPGLKMRGFKHDPLPFEIRNFVNEGWGATMKYDFNRDTGEVVTLGRFNAPGTRMFLSKGEIINGFGVEKVGCGLGVNIAVKDAGHIFENLKYFGSHLVMVYGDYTREITDLGKILGFEVVPSL